MNILREYRRVKKKSMAARISLIFTFSVILIINTYAWFGINQPGTIKGLRGETTAWDVAYYINEDEKLYLDEVATFTIDELYPGMPLREDIVNIYNLGTASTNIEYELISVKVFGQEVLGQLRADNKLITSGNTTTIFSGDREISEDIQQYPFKISYTYDKDYLKGQYVDDETTPNAHATFKFNVNWTYDIPEGTEDENIAKDALDTQFGKDAYAYYQDEANDPTKAIEIKVKITSSMIHPSLEAE